MRKKLPSNFNYLSTDELYFRVLGQAYLLLKIRPRSEKEISQRLHMFLQKHNIEKKYQDEMVTNIIKKLKEENLVNDNEFAKFWIESRLRGKPKGEIVIRSELLQKGVNKEVINSEYKKALMEYPVDDAIERLYQKASQKYKNIAGMEKRQKITRFIVSRGFTYEKVRRAIDEKLKKK